MLEKLKNAYSGGGQQPQRQEGHVNEDPSGAKPGLDSQETNEDDKEEHSADELNKGLGANFQEEMRQREHETEQEYKRRMKLIEERQLLLDEQSRKIELELKKVREQQEQAETLLEEERKKTALMM